jgi:hypothetical protein
MSASHKESLFLLKLIERFHAKISFFARLCLNVFMLLVRADYLFHPVIHLSISTYNIDAAIVLNYTFVHGF